MDGVNGSGTMAAIVFNSSCSWKKSGGSWKVQCSTCCSAATLLYVVLASPHPSAYQYGCHETHSHTKGTE